MAERTGVITMQGNPLTLLGDELKTGDKAPEFTALGNDLSPVSLSSFKGKTVVISSVPSLDTSVCDLQTRRFNQVAASLGEEVVILTLSMDLPFAQARWCGQAGVDRVITLSDHRDADYGRKYGLLIKELRLLARAVLIVGRDGNICYRKEVLEQSNEPDYEDALAALTDCL